MHIRFTIGGKHTNAVIDFPVPLVDWLWESLRQKHFSGQPQHTTQPQQLKQLTRKQLKEIVLHDEKKNEEIERLKAARKAYEEAAKLQADIAEDFTVKYCEVVEADVACKASDIHRSEKLAAAIIEERKIARQLAEQRKRAARNGKV